MTHDAARHATRTAAARAPRRGAIAARLAVLALLAPPAAAAPGDVSYTVVDGAGIPAPLSATPGDPDRGGVIFLDPARGRCAECHRIEGLPDRVADPASAGPDLSDAGARLSEAELRLIVVNPRIRDPEATMPAFFNVSAEHAAADPNAPQPALSRREVEDVVAFLRSRAAAD